MDETIYVIFKVQFDFALEVWFSIYAKIYEKISSGGLEISHSIHNMSLLYNFCHSFQNVHTITCH